MLGYNPLCLREGEGEGGKRGCDGDTSKEVVIILTQFKIKILDIHVNFGLASHLSCLSVLDSTYTS